ETREAVAVADPEAAAPRAHRLDADRLSEVLELVERGMRRPVGPDDPVGAEVRVVRLVAEVAAVRPEFATARIALDDRLVDPLPDEAALEPRIAVEGGVVVGQAAVRVAHRVRVLAHDQ